MASSLNMNLRLTNRKVHKSSPLFRMDNGHSTSNNQNWYYTKDFMLFNSEKIEDNFFYDVG